jgi:hypothetical protein
MTRSPWNSKARPILRIFSFLLASVFILAGSLALKERLFSDSIEYDSTFKFGVAALGWGIVLLIVAIRGRLFKKKLDS